MRLSYRTHVAGQDAHQSAEMVWPAAWRWAVDGMEKPEGVLGSCLRIIPHHGGTSAGASLTARSWTPTQRIAEELLEAALNNRASLAT